MSRRRAYSEKTLSIMERYFTAFGHMRESRQIRNVQTFCDKNGIDKRHFYAQEKDRGRGFFELSWLCPLVEDYGVSPRWLLTGEGEMFAGAAE